MLSRPLTYIDWRISATDGREHEAALYFEASSDLVVNTADQPVLSARYQLDGQPVLRMGSREQPILAKRGDDLRIDWGYLYLAADKPDGVSEAVSLRQQARSAFETTGHLPDSDNFAEAGAAPRGAALGASQGRGCGRVVARRRRDHDSLLQRSQAFDAELMADLTKTGGERYARLAALWPIARRWPRWPGSTSVPGLPAKPIIVQRPAERGKKLCH